MTIPRSPKKETHVTFSLFWMNDSPTIKVRVWSDETFLLTIHVRAREKSGLQFLIPSESGMAGVEGFSHGLKGEKPNNVARNIKRVKQVLSVIYDI